MDFSLVEGDTFFHEGFDGSVCPVAVVGVDSVLLSNGDRRKRIHLRYLEIPWVSEEYWLHTYWVEGVGNVIGGFGEYEMYCGGVDCPYSFTCFFNNGELLYFGALDCFITGIENLVDGASIQLFPNPVADYLQIKSDENERVRFVSIYNTMLQKVKMVSMAAVQNNIDFTDLENGLYIVLVEMDDGRMFSKRVIKQ